MALEGLSVGDAFGERLFGFGELIAEHRAPPAPWPYTDDTQMALSIVSNLRQYGSINQDALAQSFARRYEAGRGYGMAMHGLLQRIGAGEPWNDLAGALFGGQGSFGNGAAMRIAPLGAFFAEDIPLAGEQAQRAAVVTHAHPEAAAGAAAVAIAAALAWQMQPAPSPSTFIERVLVYLPASAVRDGLQRAIQLGPGATVPQAVAKLGNGSQVSAQDTVPFAIWCAAQALNDYTQALWLTASGGGDIDTTCAMVGGIVATHTGTARIPPDWLAAREPLPDWHLHETD